MIRVFGWILVAAVSAVCMAQPNAITNHDRDRSGCVDSILQHQRDALAFGRLTDASRLTAHSWTALKGVSQRGLFYALLTNQENKSTVFAYDSLLGLTVISIPLDQGNELFDDALTLVIDHPDVRESSVFDAGQCLFVRVGRAGGEHDGFYLNILETLTLIDGSDSHVLQAFRELVDKSYGDVNWDSIHAKYPDEFSAEELRELTIQLENDVFFELTSAKSSFLR